MFKDRKAFSSFSVDDLNKAKEFYGQTLGLEISESKEGLSLELAGGCKAFIYPKAHHSAATFTILNFLVPDIAKAVSELKATGVMFEKYEGDIKTDENGIFHGAPGDSGPSIAWFKDPAGNILSVIEEK